jgi:hypothetical protein
MATAQPTIHVLDKADYSKHQAVTLPITPLSPLAPSSLRFQTKILGLTTNNLSYARLGHFMGWYDIYPLPPSTPSPFNNTEKYGRVAGWGYAEILDSTVDGIEAGTSIYGFLSISSASPEDVSIEWATDSQGKKIEGQIVVLDAHRQHLWKIYNRYQLCLALSSLSATKGEDSLGFDALIQPLFGTGYNLSTFAFAWDEEKRIHPSGVVAWSAQDADLRGATVVLLNASGKTGMSFAYALRANRPKEHQPKTVIGVGSPASVEVIEKTGFYDTVVLNDAFASTAQEIQTSGSKRVVLLDFGARPGANEAWKSSLSSLPNIPFTLITVGGEVEPQNAEKAKKRMESRATLNIVNASLIREKGIEVGGEKYFEAFYGAWEEFKRRAIENGGMELQWGKGVQSWEEGWEALVRDEVRASTGLVYKL